MSKLDHQMLTFSISLPLPTERNEQGELDIREFQAAVTKAKADVDTLFMAQVKLGLDIPLEPHEQALLDSLPDYEE